MPLSDKRLRSAAGTKNEVGPRVKAQRKVENLDTDNLAARIRLQTEGAWDVGSQEIYKIEAGRRAVTDVELIALARALNCRPCYLLTGETQVDFPTPEGNHEQ